MWLSVLIQSESATYDNTAREDSPGLLLEGLPGRKGAGPGGLFFGGTPGQKPEGDIPQAFHSAGLCAATG